MANKLVTLPEITSICTTLGAKTVCKEVLKLSKINKVIPLLVTDKEAIESCSKFINDAKALVEPSCGAGLAVLYNKRTELLELIKNKKDPKILIIVCGGNSFTIESLIEYGSKFKLSKI